jgi:hypothetical protein
MDFTAPGKTSVNNVLSGGMSVTVALEPAVWALEVKGYTDSTKSNLKVTGYASVPINAGTASSFDVYLTPNFSSGGTGSLAYNVSFPASVRGWLALYPMDDTPGTSREIDISSSAGAAAIDTLTDLPEGSYRAVINLYDGVTNKAAAWTGAAHISGGSTTLLTHTFNSADFAGCGQVVGVSETSLAAKLDAALASPPGSYTIVLDGTETDLSSFEPKSLNVTGGKSITVTIRGNGETVQLWKPSNLVAADIGSIFTLDADTGSSLKLVLQDVTLRGQGNNIRPLVRVNNGATLEMKAGSFITGNTAGRYGGGVYVDGGTFTMSGGAVNDNRSYFSDNAPYENHTEAYGGGVYVSGDGTFIMNGGAVSGNTVTSNKYHTYGGGVYVDSGTFSMSGGAVNGNNATVNNGGYNSYGGGVGVGDSGIFKISGGAVNGNNATNRSDAMYPYGGGVSVKGGSFIMSGGAISGNLAYNQGAACGGGVYVDGTFTMSGGMVNGNTVSGGPPYYQSFGPISGGAYGGGVYVFGGAFSMSGGAVNGNTIARIYPPGTFGSNLPPSSSYGGGVYVTGDGTFSMSGGTVSGNTASSEFSESGTYSFISCGGGVCVDTGTFTMNGGVVSGNTASSDDDSSYGGGVSVYSGTFNMNGGAVSGNTAHSSIWRSFGGGVYVDGIGTFTMNSGEVSCNTASSDVIFPFGNGANGGGVSVGGEAYTGESAAETFTMNGGTVSGNTASSGGGVLVYFSGAFTISGGAVNGNTASSTGGGVHVQNSGTFTMSGGEVSGNILSNTNGRGGREVWIEGYFNMSGSAWPEQVFLYDRCTITISGPLSGGTVSIDLGYGANYSITDLINRPILLLDSSYSSGNLASLKEYFALGNARLIDSPYTETALTGYKIDDDGLFVAE